MHLCGVRNTLRLKLPTWRKCKTFEYIDNLDVHPDKLDVFCPRSGVFLKFGLEIDEPLSVQVLEFFRRLSRPLICQVRALLRRNVREKWLDSTCLCFNHGADITTGCFSANAGNWCSRKQKAEVTCLSPGLFCLTTFLPVLALRYHSIYDDPTLSVCLDQERHCM